ncbi:MULTISPECIES: STING domain-containing protein [Paracoccus]|uniref:Prokaryotic STING domain-containing protein n=1 Tax=Paracoccus versutus TaxID=34007 RepID=A0A3D9XCX1_PARVE|nr:MULTISPECIES: STING domain-containing protein [Paracoccus]REF68395.1 hypothetical protein BDD41_3438 [Paracoccus versutus]WGR59051.1 hypothetical protein E3U25_24640 [Paracoccus versutus]SFY45777.1 hypothetical protein SAMN04244548_05353 [Paracoccus pantotrophus]
MIRTLKLFVVGPHDEARYNLIREYIKRVVNERADADEIKLSVTVPTDNTRSDDFNDWIFGQIDSCDLLVADLTGFNPNVIYEVAFAHTLGLPCAYLRFDEPSIGQLDETEQDKIEHYFKLSLIPRVTVEELSSGQSTGFNKQLGAVLSGSPAIGETILSNYYRGVAPIDAEFVRGLAEGYYRNFLGPVLTCELPEEYSLYRLRILIPDTFELPDSDVRRAASSELGKGRTDLTSNSLGRQLGVSHANKPTTPNWFKRIVLGQKLRSRPEVEYFFDIPTTLLTITKSFKYRKVMQAPYFSDVDRDRMTDRLARRFVAVLWELIFENRDQVEWPLDQFDIVWLSKVIGPWSDNEALMNTDPLKRPNAIPAAPPRNGEQT